MPLVLEKKLSEDTILGLWEISENEDKFNGFLGITGMDEQITHPKLKLEKLAVRALIKTLTNSNIHQTLSYTIHGKPYFAKSSIKISISHKKNLAGVLLSTHAEPGLDIEWMDEKAKRLTAKFTNPEDLSAVHDIPDPMLHTLIWAAKECLYKIDGKKGLDFKKHLFLSKENDILYGHIIKGNIKTRHQIEFFHFENYIVIYAV